MFWRSLLPLSHNIKLLAMYGKTWFCIFLQNTGNCLSWCPIPNQSAVFTDTRTSNLTTRKLIHGDSKVVLLLAMKRMGEAKVQLYAFLTQVLHGSQPYILDTSLPSLSYPLSRNLCMPQSQSRNSADMKNLLYPPRVKPWFLTCPICCLSLQWLTTQAPGNRFKILDWCLHCTKHRPNLIHWYTFQSCHGNTGAIFDCQLQYEKRSSILCVHYMYWRIHESICTDILWL